MAARKKFENIEEVTKGFISTEPETPETSTTDQTTKEDMEGMTIIEKLKSLQEELPEGYVIRQAPRNARLTLLIPQTMKDKLQSIAKEEGKSTNEFIYGYLNELIKKKEK